MTKTTGATKDRCQTIYRVTVEKYLETAALTMFSSERTPRQLKEEFFLSEENANKRRDELLKAAEVLGWNGIHSILVTPIEVLP